MRAPNCSGPAGFFAKRKERGSYHHGNLKETLLDVAEKLIAERGPASITLSEMARMAGVSSAAIYRHYADLGALIGAVARRGFDDFGLRLRMAAQAGTATSGFSGMGDAYLAFARERPGAYAAMFSSTIGYTDPDLARAGETAFNTLTEGLTGALAATGLSQQAAFALAIKVWALSHGVATLAQSGRLTPAAGVVPEHILRDGVGALIQAAVENARA